MFVCVCKEQGGLVFGCSIKYTGDKRHKLLCALATRHNCIIKLLNAKQIFVYMFQKQTQVDMFIKQGSLACGHVCQVYKRLKPNEWKVEVTCIA